MKQWVDRFWKTTAGGSESLQPELETTSKLKPAKKVEE